MFVDDPCTLTTPHHTDRSLSRPVAHFAHPRHTWTTCLTNQHFTVPDLLIEALIPFLFGLSALAKAGVKTTPMEKSLLAGYDNSNTNSNSNSGTRHQ